MAIGILLKREGKEIAITKNDYEYNPEKLADIYWISNNPSYTDMGKRVVSWSEFALVFNVQPEDEIRKIQGFIEIFEKITNHINFTTGRKMSYALLKKINFRDHYITPFPRDVSHKNLDSVDICNPSSVSQYKFDVLDNINLSDLFVVSEIVKTKFVPDPSGDKDGVYNISSPKVGLLPEIREQWVTADQLEIIRMLNNKTVIHSGVLFAPHENNWREPIGNHPSLKEVFPTSVINNKDKKYLDKLIKNFVMNIPHPSDIHPYSVILRGQAWVKSFRMANDLVEDGHKVIKFTHNEIWCSE